MSESIWWRDYKFKGKRYYSSVRIKSRSRRTSKQPSVTFSGVARPIVWRSADRKGWNTVCIAFNIGYYSMKRTKKEAAEELVQVVRDYLFVLSSINEEALYGYLKDNGFSLFDRENINVLDDSETDFESIEYKMFSVVSV